MNYKSFIFEVLKFELFFSLISRGKAMENQCLILFREDVFMAKKNKLIFCSCIVINFALIFK